MTKTSTPQVSAASTAIATRAANKRASGKGTTGKGKNAGAIAALAATIIDTPKVEETKAAPKVEPVAPVVAPPVAPVVAVKPLGIKFAMAVAARPGAGAALYAHTQVFLTHSGMMSGASVPTAVAREVIGDQAIAYHTKQGNLATTQDVRGADGKIVKRGGLVLTPKGVTTFGMRKQNLELVSAFEAVLCYGEHDERTGNKNATLIRAIA